MQTYVFVKIDVINICFLGSPSGQLDHIKPFCFNFHLSIDIWILETKTDLQPEGTQPPRPFLCGLVSQLYVCDPPGGLSVAGPRLPSKTPFFHASTPFLCYHLTIGMYSKNVNLFYYETDQYSRARYIKKSHLKFFLTQEMDK